MITFKEWLKKQVFTSPEYPNEILELINYKKDGGEDWAIVQRYIDKGSYYEKSRKEAMPPEIWSNVTPTKWIEKPVRYN